MSVSASRSESAPPNRLRGLRRLGATSTHVMISTTSLALLQWAMMAVIARVDGPTALGQYALAQAFATPAGYLAWLSLRQQLIISRTGRATPADFAFLRIVVPLFVLPATVAAIAAWYRDTGFILVCACTFLIKYIEGFFDLAYGRMQAVGRTADMARTALARSLASAAVFLGAYLATRLLWAALLTVAATYVTVYATQARRFPPLPFDRDAVALDRASLSRRGSVALHLLPFALATVLMAATSNAPRVVLEHFVGPRDLGYFAAVFHFVSMGAIVVGSVGHALMPGLARTLAEGLRRAFWMRLIAPMALFAVLAGLGAMLAALAGSPLVRIIYGSAFDGLGPLLVWGAVVAAPIYASSLAANGLYAAQLRGALLWSQGLALLVLVVAGIGLVPAHGIRGVLLATAASAIVQTIICLAVVQRLWSRRGGKINPHAAGP